MKILRWKIVQTPRFRDDVVHYRPSEKRLNLWIAAIEQNAPIGTRVRGNGDAEVYDYEAGEYIIRYTIIFSQQCIGFFTLRRIDEDNGFHAKLTRKMWARFVEIVSVLSALKDLAGDNK